MLEKIKKWWGGLSDANRIAIIVPVGLAIVGGIWGIIRLVVSETKTAAPITKVNAPVTDSSEAASQVASGSGITQDLKIDRSRREAGGSYIENLNVAPGATVILNFPPIDYQDGVRESVIPEVRELFEKGREHVAKGEFREAIGVFEACLVLEKDHEKRGALYTQIGNCYYELRSYNEAGRFYADGLKEAQQAGDTEGQGSALINIANTFLLRPAADGATRGKNVKAAVQYYSEALKFLTRDEFPAQYAMTQNNLGNALRDLPVTTPDEHGENVRKAIACYEAALEIYKKDEYPVQYAMTQNNLGLAYTDLPSATAEERAENVRRAIVCYEAALEIYKKDEYPQFYCQTAANLGMALVDVDKSKACYWLKEAYALRQFLPEQGKRLEELIDEVCE